jgi:Tol biopolymer transport system component
MAGDQDATWVPHADALLVAHGFRAHERLFRIDLPTGLRTFVMNDAGGGQTHPSVSPDGNTVAFYRAAHRSFAATAPGAAQVHDLELLDLTSGQSRVLVQDVCFSVAPVWRGSGELLLGKWLTDRCALFAYRLATDQVTLLAREY